MPEQSLIELQVSEVVALTPRINLYRFVAANAGEVLPMASAGAHIQLPVWLNGLEEYRSFSLCQSLDNKQAYQVAILHEGEGGTAAAIKAEYSPGKIFRCKKPENKFPLHADASPSILIAGGIGITPLKMMAQTLLNRGRRFELHYAGRSLAEMAFVDELRELCGKRLHLYPSNESARIDVMNLLANAPSNAQFYVCGPASLMEEVSTCATLLGISSDQIHTEAFTKTSRGEQPACELLLDQNSIFVKVAQGQPLLLALRDAGLNVQYDCCVGDCGTCAVRVLSGEVEHHDHVLTQAQRDSGMMCLCVSKILSEKAVLDL